MSIIKAILMIRHWWRWFWQDVKPHTLTYDELAESYSGVQQAKRNAYLGEPKKLNMEHFLEYLSGRIMANERSPKEIHLHPDFVAKIHQHFESTVKDYNKFSTLCGAKVVPNECVFYGGLVIIYDGEADYTVTPVVKK